MIFNAFQSSNGPSPFKSALDAFHIISLPDGLDDNAHLSSDDLS